MSTSIELAANSGKMIPITVNTDIGAITRLVSTGEMTRVLDVIRALPEAGAEFGRTSRDYVARIVLAHDLTDGQVLELVQMRQEHNCSISTVNSMLAAGLQLPEIVILYETRKLVSECVYDAGAERNFTMTAILRFFTAFPSERQLTDPYELADSIVEAATVVMGLFPKVMNPEHAINILTKKAQARYLNDLQLVLGLLEDSELDEDDGWEGRAEHLIEHSADFIGFAAAQEDSLG